MICTFYSFKGGVGRSMALANVADILARQGLSVLMIDFDLEAPGLEQYFAVAHSKIRNHLGVLDLLLSYKRAMSQASTELGSNPLFASLETFILPIYQSLPVGRLDLMPAGHREGPDALTDYATNLRSFDWQDFFFNWDGENFFEWMRRRLLRPPGTQTSEMIPASLFYDVILIDSRTGVTELGGICAYQLADIMIMLCGANHQNLEGTRDMVRDFSSSRVMTIRKDRPLEIIVVPARIERRDPVLLNNFKTSFNQLFGRLVPAALARESIEFWDLLIPYDPKDAFDERVLTTPSLNTGLGEIEQAFARLAHAIGLCAPEGSPSLRQKKIEEKVLSTADVAEAAAPSWDVTRRFAPYDVFLSFSAESSRSVVDDFSKKLTDQAKLRVLLSDPRMNDQIYSRFEEVLRHCRAFLVCVGPRGITSEWQRRELRLALDVATIDGDLRLIPVLLPDADLSAIPELLREYVWADFRTGLDNLVAFDSLVRLIRTPVRPEPNLIVDDSSPYVGMSAFTERDSRFYFGRETNVQDVIIQLSHSFLILLVGPSGSGKTSFLQAGLTPLLRINAPALDGPADVITMRPGANPVATLRECIDRINTNTILIIDQLEELVALSPPDSAVWRDFFDLLSELKATRSKAVRVILALRSEFYAILLASGKLQLLNYGPYLLQPIRGDQLRQAIERPAQVAGCNFEPGLVDRILSDVASSPSSLPLAQVLLRELWLARDDGWLTNDSYDRLGGVPRVISVKFEQFLLAASFEENEITRSIVRRLVASFDDTYVRQRVRLDELVPAGQKSERVESQVRRLSDIRVLSIDGRPDGVFVELTHDSLLWDVGHVSAWLAQDRQLIDSIGQLRAAAKEWLSASASDRRGLLLSGARLRQAKTHVGTNPESFSAFEVQFIRESDLFRSRKYIGLTTAGFGASMVIVGLGVFGAAQNREATFNRLQVSQVLDSVNELSANTGVSLASPDGRWLFREERRVELPLRQDSSEVRQYALVNIYDSASSFKLFASSQVSATSFSNDSLSFAAAFYDHSVSYWNLMSRSQSQMQTDDLAVVRQLKFSPAGQLLAATGDTGIVMWRLANGFRRVYFGTEARVIKLIYYGERQLTAFDLNRTETTIDLSSGSVVNVKTVARKTPSE